MTRTSKEILSSRDKLSKDITRQWAIIRSENLIEKNGKRNYDMKELLNSIDTLSKKRIIDKLDSLAINLGIKDRKDFPKDNIYTIIYTLSEKNEMFVQLGLIPTLNPIIKLKKGKKKLDKTEELTSDFIGNLRNKLQLEINALKKKLEDYNNSATLITDKEYNLKV